MRTKPKEDEFENEFLDESKVLVEVKVSDDDGQTWHRRKICMVAGLDESGLNLGEIFQFNGEKFRVLRNEDGEMIVESLKKMNEKKAVKYG